MNNEIRRLKEAIENARLMAAGVSATDTIKEDPKEKKVDREAELEKSRKEFEKLYKEKQGKIPNKWPDTIFDY
jgi:hypothetical protein